VRAAVTGSVDDWDTKECRLLPSIRYGKGANLTWNKARGSLLAYSREQLQSSHVVLTMQVVAKGFPRRPYERKR
jgi:hypothetical protein